jgi:lipoprotein-releasing system permease protein
MYQPLLTRKYLTSKVMPLLASVGVALCVAMVLVVWSVMGGFLNLLLDSGRQLTGDVIINRGADGIPQYQLLVEMLEEREEIGAATPVIDTAGLINFPRFNAPPVYVQVMGIEPQGFDRVTGFESGLYWRSLDEPIPTDSAGRDPRLAGDGLDIAEPAGDGTVRLLRSLGGAAAERAEAAAEAWEEAKASARDAERDEGSLVALMDGLFALRIAASGAAQAAGLVAGDPALAELNAALNEVDDAALSLSLRRAMMSRGDELLEQGRTLRERDRRTGEVVPAAGIGVEVAGANDRDPDGFLEPSRADTFMPDNELVVSVLPLSGKGAVQDTADRRMPIANEFRSGLYDADKRSLFVPLDVVQEMLGLGERQIVDPSWTPGGVVIDPETGAVTPEEPPVVGVDPARSTGVLVRAAAGFTEQRAQAAAEEVYAAFSDMEPLAPRLGSVDIYTWDARPGFATFVAAVKKETALVLFLFSIISLTSVVLILAIFWAIVSEKTKDIGILRSIGASRLGVTWLFLRYGLAIGLVGSVAGSALALLIVTNINAIHNKLTAWLGIVIWDPSVYYFFRIPSEVEGWKLAVVFAGGVLASVLGALIPSLRAASLDPVRALRFE